MVDPAIVGFLKALKFRSKTARRSPLTDGRINLIQYFSVKALQPPLIRAVQNVSVARAIKTSVEEGGTNRDFRAHQESW